MRARFSWLVRRAIVAAGVAAAFGSGTAAEAGSYTTLYRFTGGTDGAFPTGPVTYDEKGNVYGVNERGGDLHCKPGRHTGCGVVYKINPTGQETTLFMFDGITSGWLAEGPLTLVDHVLYGTAYLGGANDDGVLFSVRTNGTKFTLLHVFGHRDGKNPVGPLVPGPSGSFYGIATQGGPNRHSQGGVLFELRRDGRYIHLHDFTGGADGYDPNTLLIDASGTLFGTTAAGGDPSGYGLGVVFRYVPGTKSYTLLYEFGGELGGSWPSLGSIGPDGTLYGTTRSNNGDPDAGTLFELVPDGSGAYSYGLLYQFAQDSLAGYRPAPGPLITEHDGLIGTTTGGARAYAKGGTLYRYKFNHVEVLQDLAYGANANSPTLDRNGTIYGVTGGSGLKCTIGRSTFDGCGTVYKYLR